MGVLLFWGAAADSARCVALGPDACPARLAFWVVAMLWQAACYLPAIGPWLEMWTLPILMVALLMAETILLAILKLFNSMLQRLSRMLTASPDTQTKVSPTAANAPLLPVVEPSLSAVDAPLLPAVDPSLLAVDAPQLPVVDSAATTVDAPELLVSDPSPSVVDAPQLQVTDVSSTVVDAPQLPVTDVSPVAEHAPQLL